jgi:hypothetical protein
MNKYAPWFANCTKPVQKRCSMSTKTDVSKLLAMLKARQIVTAKEARECGIRNPGARARELAEDGYAVVLCWQLRKPQTLERPAATGRGKSKSRRSSPRKISKPASKEIAAREIAKIRAILADNE